jgi:hypothetical protein
VAPLVSANRMPTGRKVGRTDPVRPQRSEVCIGSKVHPDIKCSGGKVIMAAKSGFICRVWVGSAVVP